MLSKIRDVSRLVLGPCGGECRSEGGTLAALLVAIPKPSFL